jgi:hypothetical protein
MNRVKQIKEKVEALVNEAIELLEANYDMDSAKFNNPAYMTMMDLNGALMELDCLDDEDLKTED